MDFKNKSQGTVTSHKGQSQRAASWVANKEETEVKCSRVSVAAPFAGVASQPGMHV